MKDSQTGSQIAFLTPWEIRQRKASDLARPLVQSAAAGFRPIQMHQLEPFEGEAWADEAMAKLREVIEKCQ